MTQQRIAFYVLLLIIGFTFVTHAEEGFYPTVGLLTVEKGEIQSLRLPCFNQPEARMMTDSNVKFKLADEVGTPFVVKNIDVLDNVVKIDFVCKEIGLFSILGIFFDNVYYAVGKISINVVKSIPKSSHDIALTVTTDPLSVSRALADYQLELGADSTEITFRISSTNSIDIVTFLGIPELCAEQVRLTKIQYGSFPEKINFGYQREINLQLEEEQYLSVTYVLENRYKNYILQPWASFAGESTSMLGYIIYDVMLVQ